MKTHLKVKVCTFAAEARIIRRQEKAFRKSKQGARHPMFQSLRGHRLLVLRRAARTHHLAYGFLRGREYEDMERFAHEEPNWNEIEKIALRFGIYPDIQEQDVKQRFAEWKDNAKRCFDIAMDHHLKSIQYRKEKEAALAAEAATDAAIDKEGEAA